MTMNTPKTQLPNEPAVASSDVLCRLTVTQIQKIMEGMASEISERCYCAGWMDGTEYRLWDAVENSADTQWGIGFITQAEAKTLKSLAEAIGQWFDPRPQTQTEYPCGEYFMPLNDWRDLWRHNKKGQR